MIHQGTTANMAFTSHPLVLGIILFLFLGIILNVHNSKVRKNYMKICPQV